MEETIQVEINGTVREYPKGICLLDISKEYQKDYKADIILAFVGNRLRELQKTVQKNCRIRFVTTAEDAGHKTYNRGLTLVMLKAIYSIIGSVNIRKISIEYSVGNGLYCQTDIKEPITEVQCKAIKDKMQSLIDKDLPITKKSISTADAIELFKQYGMYDKERLFRYRRVSKANIYNLEGFEDYYYGYMPPSTGYLKKFDLFLYDEGIMLLLPEKSNPSVLEPFKPQDKLFRTLKESNRWSRAMEIDTVGALNDAVVEGRINDLILTQEALQEMKIGEIAEQIKIS